MYLFATIVLVFASLVFHEMGHAAELKRNGIKIKEMGFGLRIGPSKVFRSKKIPYDLRFYAIPLMAYVRPEPSMVPQLQELPYLNRARHLGMGIYRNFIAGLGLMALGWLGLAIKGQTHYATKGLLALAVVLVMGMTANWVASHILPLASIAMLVYSAGVILQRSDQWLPVSWDSNSWESVAVNAGLISISLGLYNLLPIGMFDGGKILDAAIAEVFSEQAAAKALDWIFRGLLAAILASLVVSF